MIAGAGTLLDSEDPKPFFKLLPAEDAVAREEVFAGPTVELACNFPAARRSFKLNVIWAAATAS